MGRIDRKLLIVVSSLALATTTTVVTIAAPAPGDHDRRPNGFSPAEHPSHHPPLAVSARSGPSCRGPPQPPASGVPCLTTQRMIQMRRLTTAVLLALLLLGLLTATATSVCPLYA
jgi:hypothetical protein